VKHLVRGDSEREEADEKRERDEDLARRAAAGEAAAWSELFEAHYTAIFGFVRYRLRSPEEADDIASQVFEVAYRRADKFDYRGVPIGAWLMGIARNLVRDQVKKRVRRGYEEELGESVTPVQPDETPAVDLKQDIASAMSNLTEDQQEVLSLRFLLDKSVSDTATVMDRSEDAVKNLQRRALAAMQRAMMQPGYLQDSAG
jgi:RNA polymerase sigma-70 factor (ECF subfamily)